MELLDSEKRRARNLIWNAAGEYGFEPAFKAYDREGRADLYWNSIIGAARRDCGADALEGLFAAIHGCVDETLYEQLLWLGLESAVYQREAPCRPALPGLRERYARQVLALAGQGPADRLTDVMQEAHFRRSLGQEPELKPRDRALLDALERAGPPDGAALPKRLLEILQEYCGFVPGQAAHEDQTALKKAQRFFLRPKNRVDLPAVRGFGYGFGEHAAPGGGEEAATPRRLLRDKTLAQSEEALRNYIRSFFGPPLYDDRRTRSLESLLCTGDHKGCRLYYARGDAGLDRTAQGYAGAQRRAALKQMERNRAAYQADFVRHRAGIVRLTARIRNAMLAYLEPAAIRTASGQLETGRVWRGAVLDDRKVFARVLRTDPGQLSVDLLLDGSTSQLNRQESVAAQGYMIAESLTRCGIPVRVTSFCSLSGYTVLTRYRDYGETDRNEQIFNYFTTGCNRDGLAIRALGKALEDSAYEHRMVILLSDAKPNDVVKMARDGNFADYTDQNGVDNTAREVRALLHRGVSVVCVFTGNDEDLPAARSIYGRDFARIRSLEQFADTVGALIQNQLTSL